MGGKKLSLSKSVASPPKLCKLEEVLKRRPVKYLLQLDNSRKPKNDKSPTDQYYRRTGTTVSTSKIISKQIGRITLQQR